MARNQGGARSRNPHPPRRTAMTEAFAQATATAKASPPAPDAEKPAAHKAKPKGGE